MIFFNRFKKFIFGASALLFLLLPCFSNAANISEVFNFNVDEGYDASARSQVQAVLVKSTPTINFYIEKDWWSSQALARQNEIFTKLDTLSSEFELKIYPTLTSVFGYEWKPGVDGDNKITILFHLIQEEAAGYFRSADEFVKLQVPNSNEREMLYLSISKIDSPQLKVFLAHEFVHLITFNQKDRTFNVSEEVWLDEARADYSSNILGYDSIYAGSNLQRRIQAFLEKPSDSLTEWLGAKYDYGAASAFTHYMVDQYGINTLIDSLRSKFVGIESINYALSKLGNKEDFSQIFTDWTIASAVNNCLISQRYCYLNVNLKNLRINPSLNFLPLTGSSSLSVSNITKNWSASYQKIIGGNGDLKFKFASLAGLDFKVPYLIADKDGNYSVKFLKLDKNQSGEISLLKFGSEVISLIIIPSLQTKLSGFNGTEATYPFTFSASTNQGASPEDAVLIQKLLDQIELLKKEIARLQSGKFGNQNTCLQLNNNLYFGMQNNSDVQCLQSFLKGQGAEIYPEGLVTGYFGSLTRAAVIRFQEKYSADILKPLGLTSGTGFVGSSTRAKINQLL